MAADIPVRQNLSVASIAEFSEPISETDEIESVRKLQKLGDKAFKKKNYAEASACYKEALEIDAENVQLLSKRAVSNIELKDYPEARIDADVLVKLNPHVPQGHYLLAVCLDNLGEYGPAITAFLRALRHDQNHQAQLVDNIAVVAANLCHFPDHVLQKLDDSSPIEKLMIVAECMYESKQYEVCIHVQQTILDLQQTDEETKLKSQYLLAMCYQKHEELDRALDQFHTLLSQALSHKNDIYEASAYHNLAQLNLKVGQIHHGIVYYEKLLSICEDLRVRSDTSDAATGAMDYLIGDRLQKHVHEILTSAYRAASDLSQALFHADQYLSKTVQEDVSKDKEVVGKAYLLVGFLREGLGDYATALKHYQEYLKVSKSKNDRSGIARAYGCLGRVYHRLCNYSLAQSFYEQQHAIAEKFKYLQMVASALKNLAKLFIERDNNDEAFKSLEKYLRVSRKLDEFYTECDALIDIGDFYKDQERILQSEYYYEQAYNLAERTKLSDHVHKAGSKLAAVLVQSEEEKNIEKARFLCEESIKYFQRVQMVHEEDGTVVPDEIHQCLLLSSSIFKVSFCRLHRNLEALEHSEEENSLSFQETLAKQAKDGVVDRTTSLKFQDICKLINSQSSTVVYYDVTDLGVLTWVLKPNDGCVHFVREIPEGRPRRCSAYLKELISSIHMSEGGLQSMYDCEYRALPMLDSETYRMQLYFKSMSRNHSTLGFSSRAYTVPAMPLKMTASEPLNDLYNFLWEPIADHLTEGEVIVVSSGVLTQLSFDSLTDADGHQLGETLNVTSIPSLMVLQHLINNQAKVNDLYLADSAASAEEQASLISGVTHTKSNPASPIYLDHMHRVVVPESSMPHQPIRGTIKVAPEMAASRMPNPTHVAFDSTYHEMAPDRRDPVLAQEERRVKEGCARGSTLISKTWSGGEVPSVRDGRVGAYRQREGIAGIVVMGNPKLPEKMRLHGKTWKPNSDLDIAQMESHKVADYLHTEPCLGSKVTKEAILTQLPNATLIHLALYGSWEDGVLACAPNPTTQPLGDGVYPEGAYQIGVQDVLGMKLCSQLVVLSCCYGNRHRNVEMDLPLAFLAAGAQCVLVMLWAVNDLVRNKFWHHFYLALQDGTMVSQAVHIAKQAIRQDNRFQDARHWGAFHVIGFDQYINLMTIKHAMVDHQLNQTQQSVLNSMKEDALNIREDSEDKFESSLITKLCSHLASALTHHVHFPTVLTCILSLLQQTKKILGNPEGGPFPSWILPVEVFTSPAAVPLLNLLGFHFQPRGPTSHEPYVVFPTWDPDGLLAPALQAFEALIDVSSNAEISHCLAKVLEVHDKLTSGLIDILSITKHMAEIQLRCNDSGIHSMWVQNTARELLQAMGFRQVGKLILFEGNKSNKKQLHAVLQVLCAVSGEKGKSMLDKLDMRYLGLAPSRLAAKSPRLSPSKSARLMSSSTVRLTTPPKTVNRLRTLNPVILPGNKMDFSTPWWSEEAQQAEVKEKMKLAKSLSAIHTGFAHRMHKNRRWHLDAIEPQALEEREKIGVPPSKPRKVKMKPGASPSIPRVPIDYIEPLTAEAIEQRRDYAHFLSRVRSLDLEKRHQRSVQGLFLPYVNNTKTEAK